MNNPLVSVAVITYNQEAYIAKALASVMQQEVNFEFEVIVGDDASTDGTSILCDEQAARHPGRIKHIRHGSNVGYIANLLAVLDACSGKYVALLEADDYWTSTTKLHDQVNVLESKPDVSLCFTNASIDDTQVPDLVQYFHRDSDLVFDYVQCLQHIVAPTSTFMFRREWFVPPSWFRDLVYYEYFLIYLLAAKGSIYYLNELTACRTQHYRGQSTVSLNRNKAIFVNARMLNSVLSLYPPEMRYRVQNIVLQNQLGSIPFLVSHGELRSAWKLLSEIRIWKVVPDARRPSLVGRYMKEVLRLLVSSAGLKQLALRNVRD